MSHTQVQWARGTSAQVAAYTGPAAEIVIDTDDYSLAVQDGATAGGYARLTPGILSPQGRLTPTSGTPVLNTDTTAAATIYYTPYIGRWCPIWNGSLWLQVPFQETSLALDNNSGHSLYQQAGSLYDIFAFLNAGVFTIGTGPAWSSLSSRGSGAGTTAITMTIGGVSHGIWTSANAITLRYGSPSGNTVTVPANQATCLGTLYATANGQTGMQFNPAAAPGGSNNILGLYNAYNRVRTISKMRDSTATWTYATVGWRAAHGSNSNRISWVDGLAQSSMQANLLQTINAAAATDAFIGISINAVAPPVISGFTGADVSTVTTEEAAVGALGLNFVQAMESVDAANPCTFYAGGGQQLLKLDLPM